MPIHWWIVNHYALLNIYSGLWIPIYFSWIPDFMPTLDPWPYADSEKPLVGIKSKDGLYTDTGHFADIGFLGTCRYIVCRHKVRFWTICRQANLCYPSVIWFIVSLCLIRYCIAVIIKNRYYLGSIRPVIRELFRWIACRVLVCR